MTIPSSVKQKLPKSSLFLIRWAPWSSYWRFARFRLANCHMWQVGPFSVLWRAQWLERSARALYPHLFALADANNQTPTPITPKEP